MRLGKVLTAQQNVKVALLGRKGEKNVGARSLLMLMLRVGHAACANAEFDSAACNNGSAVGSSAGFSPEILVLVVGNSPAETADVAIGAQG
jgi:hypothetical protein